MLTYVLFFLGFIFLIRGASFLIDGSVSVAKKFNVSNFVIGLTIVSLGTSAPELLVSFIASIKGETDIVIGNVVGSNIANILLVLGTVIACHSVKIPEECKKRDIPFSIVVTFLLYILINDLIFFSSQSNIISIGDGIIFLIFLCLFFYVVYLIEIPKQNISLSDIEIDLARAYKNKKFNIFYKLKPYLYILIGTTGLFLGGKWVVEGAIDIGNQIGIPTKFISIAVIALGTSLPELVTSLVAIFKNKSEISLANIIGSNIYNILFILGITSLFTDITINQSMNIDIVFLLSISLFLFLLCFKKKNYIHKYYGVLFLTLYIGYITFLYFSS